MAEKPPPPNLSNDQIRHQIAKAVEEEDFELAAELKKKLSPPPQAPPPPKPKPRKQAPPPPKPKKGRPGQPPLSDKKSRRIKIKLGLKAKKISEELDSYTDQVGWTSSIQTNEEEFEEAIIKAPESITHFCSMCGIRMEIPRPKRDRYKVICAYPECGHEDMIGI